MTVPSRSSVIEALVAGRPDELIGVPESAWLDFKLAPYPLDTAKGKFELSKDVAALANTQGGLLVCGVGTEKQTDRALEAASDLRPFPQAHADVDRYIDTLNEYLRPRVSISHRWYPDPVRSTVGEASSCYLVIEVDPVPELLRYVIVRRVLNDKGLFVDGLAIPLRLGDRTVYMPSEDAYQLINGGLRARDVAPNFREVMGGSVDDEAEQCLTLLEQHEDWQDTPTLFWQSIPSRLDQVVVGLHSRDGVSGVLRNQDVLRQSGFNFQDSLGTLRVYEGGLLLSRRRCAIWVHPSGLLTAGAIATQDMLCWGMGTRGYSNRLNVSVLTEMTLEYFRLADELIMPRVPGPWRHRIVARRLRGDPPHTLGPGGNNPSNFLSDATPASADRWDRSWQAIGDSERDAFEALRLTYTLFGVDVASNPDVENDRVLIHRIQHE